MCEHGLTPLVPCRVFNAQSRAQSFTYRKDAAPVVATVYRALCLPMLTQMIVKFCLSLAVAAFLMGGGVIGMLPIPAALAGPAALCGYYPNSQTPRPCGNFYRQPRR